MTTQERLAYFTAFADTLGNIADNLRVACQDLQTVVEAELLEAPPHDDRQLVLVAFPPNRWAS